MGIFDILRIKSREWGKTLAVVATRSQLRNAGIVNPGVDNTLGDKVLHHDTVKIRLAHNDERSNEARMLLERRYRAKGYTATDAAGQRCPESITMATYKGDDVMGTLTVGFDIGYGLLADELYQAELDQIRRQGRRVCEFTKLAIDNKRTSKYELAGLFHMAFMYAERIWNYTDIVIEVNPAHTNFYTRMLGFVEQGPERICARVNAPAVLLRLESRHAREQIDRTGGHPELARQERSLYPYFLSSDEERKVLERLMRA